MAAAGANPGADDSKAVDLSIGVGGYRPIGDGNAPTKCEIAKAFGHGMTLFGPCVSNSYTNATLRKWQRVGFCLSFAGVIIALGFLINNLFEHGIGKGNDHSHGSPGNIPSLRL